MAYNWNNQIVQGNKIIASVHIEITSVISSVISSHCPSHYLTDKSGNNSSYDGSDYSGNNTSEAYCSGYDSSVLGSNNSSACVNSYNSTVYSSKCTSQTCPGNI